MASSMTTSASSVQPLATEIVEMIAGHLDDKTLFSFAAATRTIRSKSRYIYGTQFFTTIQCLQHPISLQRLTDLPNSPDLAKNVHTIVFDVADGPLIDPMHDEDVKRSEAHSLQQFPLRSLEKLRSARLHIDSNIISQALSKLPKLELVLVAGVSLELSYQSRENRSKIDWGSECPSGHCKLRETQATVDVVFRTVSLALSRAGVSPKIRLGLRRSRACREYFDPMLGLSRSVVIETRNRFAHLEILEGSMDTERYIGEETLKLFRQSRFEVLDINYGQHVSRGSRQPAMACLQGLNFTNIGLKMLRKLTIQSLWIDDYVFFDFIRSHGHTLKDFTMVNCDAYSELNEDNPWLSFFHALAEIPALEVLKLAYIHKLKASNPDEATAERNKCLDTSMVAEGTWSGHVEISRALEYLIYAYVYTPNPLSFLDLPFDFDGRTLFGYLDDRRYLNLRFANFKAATRYQWTGAEAKALKVYREKHRRADNTVTSKLNPVDDQDIFPIPEYVQTTVVAKENNLSQELL
ncbi:hypothetical protein PtrM4_035670 [Pyrenophora tritici-repentis]|uniref:Uncharacterized protein n=1 Tax=Pyrenophora tritici-repentis TaxID=45151 RepID=A0A316ZQJ5_9PLEO|nr:hypothetical protein PtrM4_035670 [Pyrenophora tritici-repentis]